MRISLPPRPGPGAGAVPPKTAGGPALAATQVAKPMSPLAGAGGVVPKGGASQTAAPSGVSAAASRPAGAAVARTVVDSDSGGTALAIAALVASMVAFGIVLLSYLGK